MTTTLECIRFLTDIRIKSGITLEKVSLETRITMGVLKRIEEADLEDIPDVYLRSYLVQYAKAIGAHDRVTEIQAIFSQQKHTDKKPVVIQPVIKTPAPKVVKTATEKKKLTPEKSIAHITPSPSHETGTKAKPIASIVVVAVIVIGTIIWGINTMSATMFVRKKSDNAAAITPAISLPSQKKRAPKQNDEPSLSRKEEIIKRIEEKMPGFTPKQKKNNTATKSQSVIRVSENNTADPTALLIAKNNVFVTVKKDGQIIFRSMLLKGARETWIGNDKLEVKISNPSDVILEISNSEVPTKNRQKTTNYVITGNGFYTT
jgi:cytoskeletal protein RodZ